MVVVQFEDGRVVGVLGLNARAYCVDLVHEGFDHLFDTVALKNKVYRFFSVDVQGLVTAHILVHLEKLDHVLKALKSLSTLTSKLLTVLELGLSLDKLSRARERSLSYSYPQGIVVGKE